MQLPMSKNKVHASVRQFLQRLRFPCFPFTQFSRLLPISQLHSTPTCAIEYQIKRCRERKVAKRNFMCKQNSRTANVICKQC